ncbi:MAG: sodium:solute symporter [Oscillospiraceae bacterium]|nr:sodium:solute symporter [Oscillospiraceae bacterium]
MVQTVALVFLVVFAAVMAFVGIKSAGKAKTLEGFVLGGRNVGAWMSAFAFGTTYFSAVIFVGYAGKHGWDIGVGAIWIGLGNAVIGCWLAWKVLAKRVRSMTHNMGTRTMPEFFEGRFGAKAMKLFAALLIFIFLMPYAATVYKGLGTFFGSVFPGAGELIPGVSSTVLCMLIVAVLTGVYLVLGGYIAVAMTDFIQGIIMIAGIIALVFAVFAHGDVGGPINAIKELANISEPGKNLTLASPFGGDSWGFLLTNILLTSVGTFGLPQMVHKFYAIRDESAIKRGAVISTVFAALIGCGAYAVGSVSRLILGGQLPEGGYDYVIPEMLMKAFQDSVFGSVLLSVILLMLLSASMSTLSSIVLSSSTAVTVDFIQSVKRDISPKRQMTLTRVMCLVFVALSFVFATFNFAIIVSLMSYSWGIIAGSFIGPFLWGLCSKRTSKAGAWCGMLGGFLTVVVMTVVSTAQNYDAASGVYKAFQAASANSPLFGVVAMGVSLAVTPLVSLFTKPNDQKTLDIAFGTGKPEEAGA